MTARGIPGIMGIGNEITMRFSPRHSLTVAAYALGALALSALAPLRAAVSESSLRQAADYSASRKGFSLLVLHKGRTIFEEYANGGGERQTHQIYSGTKSFFTMAALVAGQEGLLRLDEPVSATLAEWRNDPRRAKITVREVLNFTDGLDPNFHLHSDKVADRNGTALRTPLVSGRGSAFTYGPSHGQVLCELLRRKLAPGGTTPYDYLYRRVLRPLGIGDVEYRKDTLGNPLVASGIRLTARQWAKFGVMVLGRGSYDNRRILQPEWFEQSTGGSRVNPMFGLGLWTNRGARSSSARETDIEKMLEKKWQDQDWHDRCICRAAPADLVAAVGSGYQRLFVIPSMELIIVRQGTDAPFSDAAFLRKLLGG